MARVWSPYSLGVPPPLPDNSGRRKLATSASNIDDCQSVACTFCNVISVAGRPRPAGRRESLFKLLSLSLSLSLPASGLLVLPNPALAAVDVAPADTFREYTDDANKFKISIPQDWLVGAGEASTGFKSITAFYPEETPTSSVSVVITGLSADFTRIESFGKVDEFAETLVSGLDRSWQRPPGVAAKLINTKASNGIYYIEYTLQNPGESKKHLLSALGVAVNGWYNRLYTITGQFLEESEEEYGFKVRKAVSSFKFI